MRLAVVLVLVALSTPALADPDARPPTDAGPTVAPHGAPHHAIYVEGLGKAGVWGFGYDYLVRARFAIGAVGSFYQLGGDRYLVAAPYVGAYPVRGEHSSWFVHLGPQLLRRSTPSPVPEWSGMSTTSWSGEVSTGYEYRNHVLVRGYAMAALGARFAPGLGVSLGWSR